MLKSRPSITATAAALARAFGDLGITDARDFTDPIARSMLSPQLHAVYSAMRLLHVLGARRASRAYLGPLVNLATLRTLEIDAELAASIDALSGGPALQMVNLGAGYDTRAFRLPLLRNVDIFEVDHPATQHRKRERATPLRALSASLRYVPVDFKTGSLRAALLEAGFDRLRPSIWVWEAGVMYLSDAILQATLTAVALLAAPDSYLILHYREPSEDPSLIQRLLLFLTRHFAEPMIGLRRRDSILSEVSRIGFQARSDKGADEWASRYRGACRIGASVRSTRIVVARRESNTTDSGKGLASVSSSQSGLA